MGRFETERQNFIRAYTRLLVSSWSDDLYLQRLLASPREKHNQKHDSPDLQDHRILTELHQPPYHES